MKNKNKTRNFKMISFLYLALNDIIYRLFAFNKKQLSYFIMSFFK